MMVDNFTKVCYFILLMLIKDYTNKIIRLSTLLKRSYNKIMLLVLLNIGSAVLIWQSGLLI